MKKLLVVSCVFPPEPVVSAEISFSIALAASHLIDVEVVAPFPSRPYGFEFKHKFDFGKINKHQINTKFCVSRLPTFTYPGSSLIGRLFESISFGFSCYKYIISNSDQFLKVYMNTWPLFGQLGVALACKQKKISYIVHIQDIYPESLTNKLFFPLNKLIYSLLFFIERYVMRNAYKIVVISENMRQHIKKTRNVDPNKINLVYNWQDENQFEHIGQIIKDSSELTYMYLGNIGPLADIPLVINSFVASRVNAKLVIAGTGSMKETCISLARKFPNTLIDFWEVPSGMVPNIQAQADVLLLPLVKGASMSSIPSKLIAYMLSKKPIIALVDQDSDTSRAINSAKCGWVGPAGNSKWLIKTIKEINKIDFNTLNEKGICGYKYAIEHFSKERNIDLLLNVILD